MIDIAVTNLQQANVDLHPNDGGVPRALDPNVPVSWETDDPQVVIQNVSADGLHAELVPAKGTALGVVTVTASGDPDPAPGTDPAAVLTVQFRLTITASKASDLGAVVTVADQP